MTKQEIQQTDKENLSSIMRCYREIYSRNCTRKSIKVIRDLSNILINNYEFSPNDEMFLGIWDEDLD